MVDVCKYLVEEKNADINIKDNVGKTALKHAQNLLCSRMYNGHKWTIITELLKNEINEYNSSPESQFTRCYKRKRMEYDCEKMEKHFISK